MHQTHCQKHLVVLHFEVWCIKKQIPKLPLETRGNADSNCLKFVGNKTASKTRWHDL